MRIDELYFLISLIIVVNVCCWLIYFCVLELEDELRCIKRLIFGSPSEFARKGHINIRNVEAKIDNLLRLIIFIVEEKDMAIFYE